MNCTSPILVDVGRQGRLRQVPCGRCRACRITRSRDWQLRCLHELELWDQASFVTLTFAKEPYEVDPRDVQLFMKRLRRELQAAGRKCRYYACGEYGEDKGRPHYHALLFGVGPQERPLVTEAWAEGYVYSGTVTADSILYVVGYINKNTTLLGPQHKERFGDRREPFALMSKGLGALWADQHKDQLVENRGSSIKGKPTGLPRYYMRRFGMTPDLEVMTDRLDRSVEKWHYHFEHLQDGESIEDRLTRSRRQTDRNLAARDAVRRARKQGPDLLKPGA